MRFQHTGRRWRAASMMVGAAAPLLFAAGLAHAQTVETATAASVGLAEIVVTAQKRETNLQRTPISITVAGAQDLQNRRVQSLADLADGAIPSLRIAPFFSRSSALTVGIRGIVPFDANQPSRDAGVGVYIDGVYLGRSQGLGAALYDIERIEVLKGPQGTLFGRNATGGAVSIVTKQPTGEFGLRQVVGIRNFDGYSSETHLDLPRYAGVSVKVDAIVTKRDGTVENPLNNTAMRAPGFNMYDRRGLHVGALWEPTPNFSANYGFDISVDETTPYYLQILSSAAPLGPLQRIQPNRAEVADIGVPQSPSVGHTYGHVLTLTWQAMENMEVKSITSYRQLKQSQFDNGGAHQARFAPNALFGRYSLAQMHQKQWSQELQVLGSLPQLTYVAGLYYYDEEGDDWAWTPNTLQWNATGTAYTVLPSLQAGQQTPFPDRFSNAFAKSFAVFGQATWTPAMAGERLHVTVGGRYTDDKKHGQLLMSQGVARTDTFNFEDSRIDPMATVAFDVTEMIHTYAKWGTAYRAGGANSRSLIYRSFGPEEVETVEAGFKSEFWDRRARLNIAAYQTRYKEVQIDFSAVNFIAGRNIGTLETVNTQGIGKIKGAEVDLTLNPIKHLTLNASYAWTDAKLPLAPNPFANNALQRVFIVYTPKNAFSASMDYEIPLERARIRAHLDFAAADGYHALSSEAAHTQKSFVVNGRLALTDIQVREDATLQLSLWSRNLLNEAHTFVVTTSPAAGLNGQTGIFNEPRTFGIDATVQF